MDWVLRYNDVAWRILRQSCFDDRERGRKYLCYWESARLLGLLTEPRCLADRLELMASKRRISRFWGSLASTPIWLERLITSTQKTTWLAAQRFRIWLQFCKGVFCSNRWCAPWMECAIYSRSGPNFDPVAGRTWLGEPQRGIFGSTEVALPGLITRRRFRG